MTPKMHHVIIGMKGGVIMVSKRVRVTLRLSDKLNQELSKVAEQEQSSKNRIMVLACRDFVEDWKKKNAEK